MESLEKTFNKNLKKGEENNIDITLDLYVQQHSTSISSPVSWYSRRQSVHCSFSSSSSSTSEDDDDGYSSDGYGDDDDDDDDDYEEDYDNDGDNDNDDDDDDDGSPPPPANLVVWDTAPSPPPYDPLTVSIPVQW